MEALKKRLLDAGNPLGFRNIRVISAEPMPFYDEAMHRRTKDDVVLAEAWKLLDMASDPRVILPNANSIVTALYPYEPYGEVFPQGMGTFSAHYQYYPEGRDKMESLAILLRDAGYQGITNPRLPIKGIAHLAGLGRFGKNGLLHNEEFGSFMTIHILLTDAILPYDEIIDQDPGSLSDCGHCDLCVRACPTGAITEEGTVNLKKCIRHYMLSGDIIPEAFREAMGTAVLGCEICQHCCPKNAKVSSQLSIDPDDYGVFNLMDILSSHKTGLKAITEKIGQRVGSNYARAQRVLSAAVIAAGNSGDPAYIPLLKETLDHPHLPIRVHSAWAIEKLQR